MSLAQPSESATLYACPQCGVDGVFGYLKKDGDLIIVPIIGSDAFGPMRDEMLLSPRPLRALVNPISSTRRRLSVSNIHCWYGKWGSFGYGVNLRNGAEGNWFCRLHWPRQEK